MSSTNEVLKRDGFRQQIFLVLKKFSHSHTKIQALPKRFGNCIRCSYQYLRTQNHRQGTLCLFEQLTRAGPCCFLELNQESILFWYAIGTHEYIESFLFPSDILVRKWIINSINRWNKDIIVTTFSSEFLRLWSQIKVPNGIRNDLYFLKNRIQVTSC